MIPKKPLVSVIIPVYNVENYIEKCLDSVVNQTLKEIEIIVVNDGSTDSSFDILNKYSKLDSRIKVIDQENQGLSGARNTGILNSSGEYLLFVDSDDTVEKETCKELFILANKENSDIIIFNYKKIDENNKILSSPNFRDIFNKYDDLMIPILSLELSPMACNKLYRCTLFLDNNILFPPRRLHEDIPVMYQLFNHANKISFLEKSLYNWQVREGSITSSISYKHLNDLIITFEEMSHFIENYNKYESPFVGGVAKMLYLVYQRSIDNIHIQNYLLYLMDVSLKCSNKKEILKVFNEKLYHQCEKIYESLNTISNNTVNEEYIKKDAFIQKQEEMIAKRDKVILKKEDYNLRLIKMVENRNHKIDFIGSQIKVFESNFLNKIIPLNKKICIRMKEELRK